MIYVNYHYQCDRCRSSREIQSDKLPHKWILTALFGDGEMWILCGQCVANLARWFEPPDTKGVKARARRARRAKTK